MCPPPSDFEGFCLKHRPRVRDHLSRFAIDNDHLDDLEQATWVRCFERWDQLKHDGRLPWVKSVAWSVALDDLRKTKRRKNVMAGLVSENSTSGLVPDIVLQVEADEVLARVEGAMSGKLTAREQTIVRLRLLEAYKSREVARRLAIRESTVRVHLSNALRKLRQALLSESSIRKDGT